MTIKQKQEQRPAAADRSVNKRYGVNSVPGAVFSYIMLKWIVIIPIVLIEEKHTKMMPWLY